MAGGSLNDVWLLHGPNLDMLGRRDPAHYGTLTLADLEGMVVARGAEMGVRVHCFQTNHEGALIERLHELCGEGAGVIINAGAWTHYSYALRDALELVDGPIAEVHLSAIEEREEWRRRSVFADLAAVRISGKGAHGYIEALEALVEGVDERGAQ